MTNDYTKIQQILLDIVKNIEVMEQEIDKLQSTQKPWKPEIGDNYITISHEGKILYRVWGNNDIDKHLHAIGNCYPYTDEGKELAIWEQVTRRKYEKQLWEAADWVSGDVWSAKWNTHTKEIIAKCHNGFEYCINPRFATKQSAIEAHTRILGDDAERYFTGK